MESLLKKLIFTGISHISFIVKSVDEMVKMYFDHYSIGPWRIWNFGPDMEDVDSTVGGKRMDYKIRLALADIGTNVIELIQPRDNTGIYADFLNTQGEGFHHFGYEVENYKNVMKYIDKSNIKVLIEGVWHDKGKSEEWVYIDLKKDLNYIVEITNAEPGFYPDPLEYYPVK